MMRRQAELMRAAMENHGQMLPPVALASDTNNKEQLLLAEAVEEEAATAATAAASSTGGDEGNVQGEESVQTGGRSSTVRDAIGHQKRHNPPIKLKEYSGATSIETFFRQFRTCAVDYHWTEEDKGVYLRCQQTGDAANLLWAQPNADEIQFNELERMLRARFRSADQEEKFQTKLRARRRVREELLQALHADITRLMALV